MAGTLNDTPGSNRLHIGVFGKTNSGKSSFINAFTHQEVSIVADVAGTTTDPVYKPMEISPLGPCVIIDTAGFDDETELGERRVEKTKLAAEKADIAVIVVSGADACREDASETKDAKEKLQQSSEKNQENLPDLTEELKWYQFLKEKNTPVLFLVGKADIDPHTDELASYIKEKTGKQALTVSAKTGAGIDAVREELARLVPENYGDRLITGDLVTEEDFVLLVMPQDIQAPKGRLILPQVQTLRELLDKKCLVMSVTTDKLLPALAALKEPPKLIITDSQAGVEGLRYANAKGLPVIIMEPLRGGRLVNLLPESAKKLFRADKEGRTPAELALKWLYNQPEVTCVLSGMNSMEMVEQNLKTASESHVGCLTASDAALIEQVKEEIKKHVKVGCTGCGYCMPCPRGVDIPGTFRCYNAMYSEGKKSGRKDYLQCTAFRKDTASASQCVGCGKCEKHCPQHIEIRKELKCAASELEDVKYKVMKSAIQILKLW